MEPISAITTAISGIKTATEIAQILKTTDKNVVEAEYRIKIADLLNSLADTKISIAELKDIIQKKDEEIKILQEKIEEISSNKNKMIFKESAYYSENDDGPFCTNCYDTKEQKVRLTKMPHNFSDFGKWKCPNCGAMFN